MAVNFMFISVLKVLTWIMKKKKTEEKERHRDRLFQKDTCKTEGS